MRSCGRASLGVCRRRCPEARRQLPGEGDTQQGAPRAPRGRGHPAGSPSHSALLPHGVGAGGTPAEMTSEALGLWHGPELVPSVCTFERHPKRKAPLPFAGHRLVPPRPRMCSPPGVPCRWRRTAWQQCHPCPSPLGGGFGTASFLHGGLWERGPCSVHPVSNWHSRSPAPRPEPSSDFREMAKGRVGVRNGTASRF